MTCIFDEQTKERAELKLLEAACSNTTNWCGQPTPQLRAQDRHDRVGSTRTDYACTALVPGLHISAGSSRSVAGAIYAGSMSDSIAADSPCHWLGNSSRPKAARSLLLTTDNRASRAATSCQDHAKLVGYRQVSLRSRWRSSRRPSTLTTPNASGPGSTISQRPFHTAAVCRRGSRE